ncbi:glyoxalase [Natronospirillum operosum]|uniref:Glyoxalase n=1 Tax=Natronospirillum operosum TaxID=2759953 RepID=A0A4Z0WFM1_9GAMM|nr:VOC family protein [Natronospirillum operosum]TGG94252.1 glyoxalase [Natronospirillum operosum]
MSIVGIEAFEFGVADMKVCQRFLRDFGLRPEVETAEHAVFRAQNGARIEARPLQDPTLPTPFEEGSTLRRMTWGVADATALETLRQRMAEQPGFEASAEVVQCRDPNGMTVRVMRTALQPVELRVPPINQHGDMRRVDEPSPVYERAEPVGIGHAVFFVEDLAETEAFYRDVMGFHASDRYTDRGVFMRMQARGGHHNLFLLKIPNKPRGLNHVAFTVRDIHEVIGGGIHMTGKEWTTFIGPGRHPVSSAYFWYVNSPLGGAFEYYTNEDYLTENWQAREMEHSLTSFTEWAIEGGIDDKTRRQKKD